MAGQAIKQGFGWGIGCLLFVVAAVVGLALLGGVFGRGALAPTLAPVPSVSSVGSSSPAEASVAPSPLPSQAALTVSGVGEGNSAPLDLAGSYQVAWTAQARSAGGCFHGANLRTVQDERASDLISVTLDDAKPHSGTIYVYALPAGRYFVALTTGCQKWSFTFAPIR